MPWRTWEESAIVAFRVWEYTYNAHALPRSNQCCDTDHEANSRKYSPASTGVTETDENGTDDSTNYAGNTKTTGEDDPRCIAVTNGPADEIGVGLMT